jgi:hypothetical protein
LSCPGFIVSRVYLSRVCQCTNWKARYYKNVFLSLLTVMLEETDSIQVFLDVRRWLFEIYSFWTKYTFFKGKNSAFVLKGVRCANKPKFYVISAKYKYCTYIKYTLRNKNLKLKEQCHKIFYLNFFVKIKHPISWLADQSCFEYA